MKTIIAKVNKNQAKTEEYHQTMNRAGQIIKDGGLVAFPTETVYGLGGDALNPNAARAIYEAKGRPSDNPLIVHIADFDRIGEIVSEIPESARLLAKHFWPGPLTMILKKNDRVPMETTGGLDTVAIRLPSDEIALDFISATSGFVAAPSANTSGRPSPTLAEHVIEDLNGKIDMIIDGGSSCIGLESTIIDLSEDVPTILRPGFVTRQMLSEVLGNVVMDKGLEPEAKVRPKAPGMKYRHYAPKADMTLISGDSMEEITAKLRSQAEKAISMGYSVGIIATEETKDAFKLGQVITMGTLKDANTLAAGLYDVLREFDEKDVDVIYAPCFSKEGIGQALYNRMLKAAGHKVL